MLVNHWESGGVEEVELGDIEVHGIIKAVRPGGRGSGGGGGGGGSGGGGNDGLSTAGVKRLAVDDPPRN
jgi:hypothetical protein